MPLRSASPDLSSFVATTPASAVEAACDALGLAPGGLADRLAAAEERAAEHPEDRRLHALARALEDAAEVEASAPRVVAGVRRDRLVRWDRTTATYTGTDVEGLAPMLVRVLRPGAGPAARRAAGREWRLLRRVLPLECDDDAARLPIGGLPTTRFEGPRLARGFGSALADLARWSRAGLRPPPPEPEELRLDPTGAARLAVLSLADDEAPALASLFARLDPDDPLCERLAAPSSTVGEASARLVRALAEQLAGERHALAERWRAGRQAYRRDALRDQVRRLAAAVPPPAGLGAVGVDLDGKVTVVRGGPRGIWFGPADAPEVVWDPAEGLRPPIARRLLRVRALSPPNAALDARVGGDPVATERLCRWVADGLRLRTLRLLLEATA